MFLTRGQNTRQPRGPRRVSQRWLNLGLKLLISPTEVHRTIVGGKSLTFANDATKRLEYFEFPGTNGYIDWGTGSQVALKGAHTLLSVFELDSLASTYPVIASYECGDGRVTLFVTSDATYSDLSWGKANADSGSNTKFDIPGSVTGVEHSIVLRGGGVSTMLNCTGWRNGAPMAASNSGVHGAQSGNNILGQASTSSLTFDFDGRMRVFALFDALLPEQLCKELSANPWQIFEPIDPWVPLAVVAGGGQTIAVPAGALTLTGFAPTVSAAANVVVSVPAGALALTGFAPTVVNPHTIAVPAGALTLTGFAPSVLSGATIAVPAGSLTLTGFAPSVVTTGNQLVTVPAGNLTITGYAPTVIGEVVIPDDTHARGGAYRNRFVEGRKRIALQRLLSYLTEDDPPAETKRQVRAVKAGKPVPPEERKPPVVMQEVSAQKLAAKIIPERIQAIEQAAAAGLDVQRVILKAIEMARERDEEEVMLLL